MTPIIRCGMRLLIYPQTSTVKPLKFGMDNLSYPTLYLAYEYLSMPGLKLIRVGERGPKWCVLLRCIKDCVMEYWKIHIIDIWLILFISSAVIKKYDFYLREILQGFLVYHPPTSCRAYQISLWPNLKFILWVTVILMVAICIYGTFL